MEEEAANLDDELALALALSLSQELEPELAELNEKTQEKTEQEKTEQEKTEQEKTEQEKTDQLKRAQEKTEQEQDKKQKEEVGKEGRKKKEKKNRKNPSPQNFSGFDFSSWLPPAMMGQGGDRLKMILVVRTDLNMAKGKLCAQCGHATLGAYKQAVGKKDRYLMQWEVTGEAKIALKVDSLEKLHNLKQHADRLKLNTYLVTDAGHTQVAAGSVTVLAIGPGPESIIDKVTGHLKLL